MNSNNNPHRLNEAIKFSRTHHEFEDDVLTDDALKFLTCLHENFDLEREDLIRHRQVVQNKLDDGWNPSFLNETLEIRESNWKAANPPSALVLSLIHI